MWLHCGASQIQQPSQPFPFSSCFSLPAAPWHGPSMLSSRWGFSQALWLLPCCYVQFPINYPSLLQGDHPQLMAQRPGSIHPHLMAFPALCPDLALAQFASVWIFSPHLLTFLSCMPPKPQDKSPFCSLPLTQERSPHLPAHPLGIFHWNNCALRAPTPSLCQGFL